jgi:hypothetical protein
VGKNWKDSLKEDAPGGDAVYRYDVRFVGASTVAQQFYCEAKVENEYRLGEVPTEDKSIGTGLHDEIFAMESVKREDLIRHIEGSPSLTASFGLRAQVGDLSVAGVPDAVIFEGGRPKWVVELKTTRGDPSKLWPDQAIQVKIYGPMLERMGFDCSSLSLVLVRMKQKGLTSPEKEQLLVLIKTALERGKTTQLEAKHEMNFFLLPYVSSEPEAAIVWAQDYWLKKREAIPTKVEGKCRSCEFNAVCAHSLFKPPKLEANGLA